MRRNHRKLLRHYKERPAQTAMSHRVLKQERKQEAEQFTDMLCSEAQRLKDTILNWWKNKNETDRLRKHVAKRAPSLNTKLIPFESGDG